MKTIDGRNLKPLEDNNMPALSPQQRNDINRLAGVYDEAVKSGNYTPEELQTIRGHIEANQQGVRESASLRVPEPTLAERFNTKTYTDQNTGQIFPIQKDGTFGKPIYAPPEQRQTLQDYDALLGRASVTDATGKTSVDMNKLRELATAKREIDAILRGETTATPNMPLQQPQTGLQASKTVIDAPTMNNQLKSQGGAMASPKSKADYDMLPSGAIFVDPNGTMRRKP